MGPAPRPSSETGTPTALPRQRPHSRGHNARYWHALEVFTCLNLPQEWQQVGRQRYHAAARAHHQKYKLRSAREIIFTWWQTPWGTRLPVSHSAPPVLQVSHGASLRAPFLAAFHLCSNTDRTPLQAEHCMHRAWQPAGNIQLQKPSHRHTAPAVTPCGRRVRFSVDCSLGPMQCLETNSQRLK